MALNYNTRYPSQTDVDLVYYPYGKAKNVSSDDAEDGFPFERDYINDQFGFFQKILKESGITPNGTIDTAASSQYYNALTSIITNTTYADTESLVAGITTRVDNLDGELSDAQLELTSTVDELGAVSSRAYLGVSDTVDGKADITGVVFESQTNGIRFRGDIFELTTSADEKALSYNAASDQWVFTGKLVIGDDYEINGVEDIEALSGSDGQSLTATDNWQFLNSNDGWTSYALTETLTPSYMNVVSTSADAYMFIEDLSVTGAASNVVSLRVRNNLETTTSAMEVYYATASHTYNEGFKKTLSSVNLRQGEWATVVFDMRELTAGGTDWVDNTITGIRIDLVDTLGADLDIDNIAIGYYGAASASDGLSGAGFYGAIYDTIDWTLETATTRFTDLVGRPPVQYDIFTQSRTDGTDSQSRSYKDDAWVAPSLLVNGDIIATGTVAGDRLIAGTEINSPLITAGTLRGGKVEMIGSTFMKVSSATPFGPNNLIEWYGTKTGNITGNEPIYANLTKTNAITYLGDDGSAYFGGTIIAGNLVTSTQNPSTSTFVVADTETFGSNGGQIAIACSVTSNGSSGEISGTCTTKPDPTVTLDLYEVSPSDVETLVDSQDFTGNYSCSPEGAGNIIETYNLSGSFTYFDNELSMDNRHYRLKATFNNTFENKTQRVSIVTQEA